MDTRTLQIVHEFDNEPTYIVTRDDDHEDIATVEPSTPNAVQVADELVRRWNAYPELVVALEALELRCTQARIASNIGQPRLKDADFLRRELERIATDARAAITNATNNH